ncbi:MAG: Histidine--tRNA ligase [Proteobacteria bacterium]|jgi:histidyl-tRNA synthetase|nr:MAG: Histidine--tRNA ligase [Pseudomonadota bacterium]
MAKIRPISGFPEFLPQQRIVEQQALDVIRHVYELFGFINLETRTFEPVDVLAGNGDDKEIYAVSRLFADEASKKEAKLGLHFDLTVPFARYVQQNKGELTFPFRRYQMQKVFRGERPQAGRFREFLQADIDVICENELPLYNDIEVLQSLFTALYCLHDQLQIPAAVVRLNNRKLLEGFYRGLGITDIASTLRIVDKLDKIGAEEVKTLLVKELELSQENADKCVAIAQIKTHDLSFVEKVRELGVEHEMLDEGLEELAEIMDQLQAYKARNFDEDIKADIMVDLSIARGLAYYTGMVFETFLMGHEDLGSISSGGRYDNLASDEKTKLPGVGASIGLTRILSVMFERGVLAPTKKSTADVFVAVNNMETRIKAQMTAEVLRIEGFKVEISSKDNNLGKQIQVADKKGIEFVAFYDEENPDSIKVKNIVTGQQISAKVEDLSKVVEFVEQQND